MSERYITDRYLPDKAIDLIDEACSDVNLHNRDLSLRMETEKEVADLKKNRNCCKFRILRQTQNGHAEQRKRKEQARIRQEICNPESKAQRNCQ